MNQPIATFVITEVIPGLSSHLAFKFIVETTYSVIKVFVKAVGHRVEALGEAFLNECFLLIRERVSNFPQLVISACENGPDFVNRYVQDHHQVLKKLKEPVGKLIAKSTIRAAGKLSAKFGFKEVTKFTAGTVTRGALTATLNPAGIVADVAQLGFEATGNKRAGRMVGLSGNVIAGVTAGGIVGGPAGAAVGGVASAALWGFGEMIGYFMG